ncbi:MAG: chemotaxis protein CheB, partial [Bacteroidota bacterium]|nr:chemotaxis protein CheB [Bacteroidota bacterium]
MKISEEEQLHSAEETSIGVYSPPDTNSNKFPKEEFPIVGIGASAGGLAAFEAFFSAIPDDIKSGMAFVLVQHLDPTHKSILSDLVGRYTRMPVYEVKKSMVVHPDCVYVIPPNHDLVIEYGVLQLQEPAEPHGHRLPIDLFFRSLAQSKQEMAIGIVLSGTGNDGT